VVGETNNLRTYFDLCGERKNQQEKMEYVQILKEENHGAKEEPKNRRTPVALSARVLPLSGPGSSSGQGGDKETERDPRRLIGSARRMWTRALTSSPIFSSLLFYELRW
jgi:hypothetical protein